MLAESPERLLRVSAGERAVVEALSVLRDAIQHTLRLEMERRPLLPSSEAVLDYLRASMAFDPVEEIRVLHLNTRNLLIRDEVMFRGTVDESVFHIREVIRRALELGSSGIVVAHNHPSGDPTPSPADIALTRKLVEAGHRLGLTVQDHIIIAKTGHSSLRALGLL